MTNDETILIATQADAIVVIDAEGTVLFANEAAAGLFHRPLAQLVGGPFGLPVTGDGQRRLTVPRSGAPPTPVDMRVCPIEWDGHAAWMATLRDMTALEDACAELSDTRRRLQVILESVGDGVVGLDRDGRITIVNSAAAAIIGFQADEAAGRDFRDLVHARGADPMSRNQTACPIALTLQDGVVRHTDAELFDRRDGTPFPVELVVAPLRDASGELAGAILTFRDVTERHRLEEDLRQAQRLAAIGRLASGAAHDFNNQLTAILCYADLLAELVTPECVEPLGEMRNAATRAAQLTRQLLAFGRRQALRPAHLSLTDVVADGVRMLERLVGERYEIECDVPDALGLVKADREQLGQVLVNLVINARDAMPSGGSIVIACDDVSGESVPATGPDTVPPGAWVRLRVRDTGCGMSDEMRTHIFEPFYTTKEAGRGTGLGLATVYGVVKQSGGHIVVESRPGDGSTFSVFLPRVDPPLAGDLAEPDSGVAERTAPPATCGSTPTDRPPATPTTKS